ncbi:sugar phosphate isomerase/epimerase family protein [Actinoalloteichus hymeniacidonis]|uniref:Xylose isomerase-like enzyme n=1 Tax=Actinoalloteichus hymeniacidonis TaxID=340345 RepID=A0AAC9HS07_9PSEU|nr:TIM barrel protein [Actinoalloteichus hymeniacidonis]AOS64328.1 xylose isomerase-like enzyme [Actinoalloteichus hymeniacidonis]MBB5907604.1 L-ribulose-5-phosphate 3-epimerase [Actinoalloteichus hymeniacidonis]
MTAQRPAPPVGNRIAAAGGVVAGVVHPTSAAEGAFGSRAPSADCLVGMVDWRIRESGPAAVRRSARLGVDGIQLDLGGPGTGPRLDAPGRLDAVREIAESTGVRLLAVCANRLNDIGLTARAGSRDAARVQRVLDRLLDAAHFLGAPLVIVPGFRRSAIGGPEHFARTAAVLREAARAAEARNLLLGSMNRLDARWSTLLAKAVGSAAFRLMLNPANVTASGTCPVDFVGETAGLLADQVALKEVPPDVRAGPEPGSVTDRLDDTLDALRAQRVPVRALVSETDHRDGDPIRLAHDLDRLRRRARLFTAAPSPRTTPGGGAVHPSSSQADG